MAGVAVLSLGEVFLTDESLVSIVEFPLQVDIDVQLRPESIGTLDDQAMRVGRPHLQSSVSPF